MDIHVILLPNGYKKYFIQEKNNVARLLSIMFIITLQYDSQVYYICTNLLEMYTMKTKGKFHQRKKNMFFIYATVMFLLFYWYGFFSNSLYVVNGYPLIIQSRCFFF